MSAPAMPASISGTDLQNSLAAFLHQLGGNGSSSTDVVPPEIFGPFLGSVRDLAVMSPNKEFVKQPQKDFRPARLIISKEQIGSKDFWGFLGQAAQVAIPLIVGAVTGKDFQGKAYTPPTDPKSVIPAGVDKDFWDALGGFLTNVTPIVLDALQGKDFNPGNVNLGALPLQKDINWGQVAQTGLQLLPFVLSLF
jgi:hypothetical protein